ncbi:hypothetical protein FPSE_03904 [Fusarium pseudograminearum CS3096]|uniref:C2H2-type domain-containing protein n=1 Tax=Fusarium pseudograminearum (strain CS3096) TaxID=1028729 RepID=K3UTW0_FUSPC|nr:hypothetical protein FPSE_03904 [Fusarium pseudograminearum CS3096]EKJ75956.1 hypothetical protein FPSE_03904 [Fusarium pseudograminearum CS3096]
MSLKPSVCRDLLIRVLGGLCLTKFGLTYNNSPDALPFSIRASIYQLRAMASLKNIMNTEDEPIDPRSESRSTDLTSKSPSVHSYVTPLNYQTHSPSHINPHDPSGSSKSSSVIDPSSPTTADLNMNNRRRRSNMSIDSNDTHYATQHASSSNALMRPFTTAASGESRVRLTPITGKISKAKKGVLVHNCDQCPKTFSRAEHLRRHQLSHSPPELYCSIPGCNKTFYRKDLLDRHVQRHDQDAVDIIEPEHPPAQGSSKTHLLSPAETTRPKPIEAFNDPQTLAPVNSSSNVTGAWQPMTSAPNINRNYKTEPSINGPADYTGHYALGPELPAVNNSFMSNYDEPRIMPAMPILPTLHESATPELHWQGSSGSTSAFSTPPNNSRRTQFPVPVANEPWMTPASTYQGAPNDISRTSMDHVTYSAPYVYNSTPPQVYTPVFGMDLSLPGYPEDTTFSTVGQTPNSTVRSVSPSLAVAQSETLLAVPSLPTSGGTFDLASCSSGTSGGNGLLSTHDLMPLSLSSATSEAIPRYLEVYWDQVHPKEPIIHKHTYQDVPEEETEHIHVLQCAMAALATQLIPNADDRMKGAELHAYALHKSKVFTRFEKWSMPVQHTIALCEYYARFRGKNSYSHQPSTRFTSLYNRVVSDQLASTSRPSIKDGHQAWKAWIAAESRRRLLAACFLLDVHSSWYHERQYTSVVGLDYSSPSTLPIPLTATTTKAWEACDPQSWSKLRTRRAPKSISNTNLRTLSASDIASGPAFDAAVLLAVYSLSLPRRQSPSQISLVEDVAKFKSNVFPISRIFPQSAIASTYLALHHTPLYHLLSVSGKTWVFNKKLTDLNLFAEHQKLLDTWRSSGTASIATVFAARSLKLFLNLQTSLSQAKSSRGETCPVKTRPLSGISNYWGIYVCSLICWAFGLTEEQDKPRISATQDATKEWILRVASQEPSEVHIQSDRNGARGVVGLVRQMLSTECLGGGNKLFFDAINVLIRLEGEVTSNC